MESGPSARTRSGSGKALPQGAPSGGMDLQVQVESEPLHAVDSDSEGDPRLLGIGAMESTLERTAMGLAVVANQAWDYSLSF